MVAMEVITALVTITMPIVATVLLSGRQTHRILEELGRCLVKIDRTQRDIHRCLLKLDLGFRANAAMHGWERRDGLTPEQIYRLPRPKVYDEKLGVCYFKSD
jgi:hypothetical protein